MIECEVINTNNRLYFIRNNTKIKLNQAVNYTDFVCYKTVYYLYCIYSTECRNLSSVTEIALIPTHVIFKENE